MTRSLKYGLLLAAALAAPASAADPGLTEAIAFHCGWQFGMLGMQSTEKNFPSARRSAFVPT
jgi:hypothetical protein